MILNLFDLFVLQLQAEELGLRSQIKTKREEVSHMDFTDRKDHLDADLRNEIIRLENQRVNLLADIRILSMPQRVSAFKALYKGQAVLYLELSTSRSYSAKHNALVVRTVSPNAPVMHDIRVALAAGRSECPLRGLTHIEEIRCELNR